MPPPKSRSFTKLKRPTSFIIPQPRPVPLTKTKTIERNDSAEYIRNLFIQQKEHRIKYKVLQDIKVVFKSR